MSNNLIVPTRVQFKDYIRIRNLGVVNMFDVKSVCDLSVTNLTEDLCFFIMNHFETLAKEFNVDI